MGVEIEMKDNTAKILTAFEQAVSRGLDAIGMTAEAHAKQTINDAGRIDTGRLINSISHNVEEEENAVYIGTNVEYAIWHEVGTGVYAADGKGRKSPWAFKDEKTGEWIWTKGVKPLHFLQDAACNHSDEYKKIMKASIDGTDL